MRSMSLLLLCLALASAAFLYRDRLPLPASMQRLLPSTTLPAIKEIRSYTDHDFAFSMAVPLDWAKIIADEPLSEIDELETAYAVGFESPRTYEGDRFADYIMVEILPGAESGAFETDGSLAKTILIDGFPAEEDELLLRDYVVGGEALDLQVYQAELYRLGYTVGFYAIGELREADALREAFRLMIETFRLPPQLFDISSL